MLPELRRREKIQTRFLPEDEQDLSACERQKEDKVTGDRGFPRYVPDQSACVTQNGQSGCQDTRPYLLRLQGDEN